MEEILPAQSLPTPVRKKSALRFLWGFIKWTFFSALFLVGLSVVLAFIFEKDIIDLARKELNKHLNAEVVVSPDDIDLTILKTFPNAGIEFKNVIVYEALNKKVRDTIINAGKISLQFNVMDLFDKKYDIKKILVTDTKIDFLTDKNGKNNFDFLKENPADTAAEKGDDEMKFKLELIEFRNVRFNYKNKKEFIKVSCRTKSATMSGAFAETDYTMNAGGTFFFDDLVLFKRALLKNKTLVFKSQANVNGKNWSITNTELAINQLTLSAKGAVNKKDSIIFCDLDLGGKDVDVASALSLLPESQQEKVKDYESTGNFYFRSLLKGELNNFEKLAIDVSFGIEKATIKHKPSDSKLTGVNLTGRYAKEPGSKDELSLKNVSASMGSNFIKGDCQLKDLADPMLELSASINAELAELIRFYPIDTIQSLSGKINVNAKVSGMLRDLKNDYAGQKESTSGSASVENLSLLFRHSKDSLKIKSGSFEILQNDLRLQDVLLNPDKNDLLLNGELQNFFAWLLKENEPLNIRGRAKSSEIKIDKFLAMFSGSEKTSAEKSTREDKNPGGGPGLKISDKFNLDFEIEVAKASWDNFVAEDVKGNVRIKDGKILADDLSFKAFDGEVSFSGFVDGSKEKIAFKGSSELVTVNINKMFSQLGNFSQDVIQDKHLKGIATVSLSFSTLWNQNLDCDLSSIVVTSDVLIERGELLQYKPLEALSKYIDIKELNNIKFSTLKSHIDIKDQTVFISKTDINSSALNITLGGTHTFDNKIDYHLSLLISELLAKKPGKKKELDEELRYVENDPENKRTVFILMTGTMDDIKIKYDRRAAKEKIKEDIRDEKKNLKQILHEEFGLFKKDTAQIRKDNEKMKKAEQKFIVEFGEKKESEKEKKKTTNEQKKKQDETEEDDDF